MNTAGLSNPACILISTRCHSSSVKNVRPGKMSNSLRQRPRS
ncbi:hypothetical protein CPter91_4518 [Collimonas pratensis]|uniref:Uncharacterized protein n=1 Tax=Collimonas pratensis TaxID=279113 RepID=A0A127QAE2_9BURK|nr:hypothetical protein CPter91_4518 [Collimonas pratensis]